MERREETDCDALRGGEFAEEACVGFGVEVIGLG